jgi:hypothetical protein
VTVADVSTKITVPSGCTGLDMADGTRYDAPKQGTSIEVPAGHARAIKRSWYGQAGVITGTSYVVGTRTGRWCEPCRRTWNAWSTSCPRCGNPTTAEENHP